MIVAGNHIYERCPYCVKMVRVSGFLGGLHMCLTPAGGAEKEAGWRSIDAKIRLTERQP